MSQEIVAGATGAQQSQLPPPFVSCAQNGEDVRVWRALRHITNPRYVEVGAQHPVDGSPTAALYVHGWRGVLIEPDPTYAALLRAVRPEDVVIEAAAAEAPGSLEFTRFSDTGLSTASPDYIELARARGFVPEPPFSVPVVTLNDVFSREQGADVHFLTIDVEGWESRVIEGLDLHHWRPWIIALEAIAPGSNTYVGGEVRAALESRDYMWVVFDGINDWFVAIERGELADDLRVQFSAADRAFGWRPASELVIEKFRHEVVEQMAASADLERTATDTIEQLERVRTLIIEERALSPVAAASDDGADPIDSGVPPSSLRETSGPPTRISIARRIVRATLPEPVRRHIAVRRNFRRFVHNYTAPAFVGERVSAENVGPTSTSEHRVPARFLDLTPLAPADAEILRDYLLTVGGDDDESLARRIDGQGDAFGRMLSDLRVRARLAQIGESPPTPPEGDIVLFDARALQQEGLRNRGIGNFTRALLASTLAQAASKRSVLLLVDPFDSELPPDIREGATLITSLKQVNVEAIGLFVQPSPMTSSVSEILPLLERGVTSVTIVYDFIPAEYPDVYLSDERERLRYATQLDALRRYSHYLPISESVRQALSRRISGSRDRSRVAWPPDLPVEAALHSRWHSAQERIVVFGANEPRKNTLAALAGIAKAFEKRTRTPKVAIIGMAKDEDLARHWVGLAGLSNEQVEVAPFMSDAERDTLIASSRLVLVPSFAEGLSLPVIEALAVGTAVVASDIDVHRELLGTGSHLAHPARPEQWASAVRNAYRRPHAVQRQQARAFGDRRRASFEDVLADILRRSVTPPDGRLAKPVALPARLRTNSSRRSERLRIGVATPWPPQQTGVADYSFVTLTALAEIADVTIYTSSSARSSGDVAIRSIERAFSEHGEYDHFISVMGNSAFHLPMIQLLRHIGGVSLCHDSRMVELYAALEGPERAANLLTGGRSPANRSAGLVCEEVLYQNLGFAELAALSSGLLVHSGGAAKRIERETGSRVAALPFVPQRRPADGVSLLSRRRSARDRLRFSDGEIHIVSAGIIDPRTKLNDHIVEACAWLRDWGLPVRLHFVGSDGGHPTVVESMIEASRTPTPWVSATGYVPEDALQDYLHAADLVMQLRAGDLPSRSGPVVDAMAFGATTLASAVLVESDELPGYVHTYEGATSPLLLAERIRDVLDHRLPVAEQEEQRRTFLASHSSAIYAERLLEQLERFR